MATKKIKAVTLENKIIDYVERQSKIENRNFSNMINVLIGRYRRISEQLDQGIRLDLALKE